MHQPEIGDRVRRAATGKYGNIKEGWEGTVVRIDREAQYFNVSFDNAPHIHTEYAMKGGNSNLVELLKDAVLTKLEVWTPTACDTCKNPNHYQAPANVGNAFRCGQCRALRGVFA